ncbi:discoidin domain-containing protein [Paenibacillus sp. FSL K6-1230]|uniref:discoidin domain-containing protein n=1 Tax=Paenibacillus sp. FSL K6-1230 TaxID=2921603 RepID=UPI0030FB806A
MGMISKKNAIPKMTSNTTPSGVANASSNHYTSQSYFAFDYNYESLSSAWTTNGITTGWITYQFSNPIKIGKYCIYPQQTALTRAPKNWTFEGSNDRVVWDTLDTQINVSTWANSVKKEYIILNPKPYINYRLNITANNGDAQYLSVGELEMYEFNHFNKILLSSDNRHYAIEQTEGLGTPVIPVLTQNNDGVYIISANQVNDGEAYQAFDRKNSTRWGSTSGTKGWLAVDVNVPVLLSAYTISSRNDSFATQTPSAWTFEGSNDNQNWEIIDSRTGQNSWSLGETKSYYIAPVKSYRYYRLNITAASGSSTLSIGEFQIYKRISPILISFSENTLKEEHFIKYGIDTVSPFGFNNHLNMIKNIETISKPDVLGEKFTHTIDMSNRRVIGILLS